MVVMNDEDTVKEREKAEQEEQDRLKVKIEESYEREREVYDFIFLEEKKIVSFQVYNTETEEVEEMTMDAQSYKDFCEAEDEAEKRREAHRKARSRLDQESLRYDRD